MISNINAISKHGLLQYTEWSNYMYADPVLARTEWFICNNNWQLDWLIQRFKLWTTKPPHWPQFHNSNWVLLDDICCWV